MKPIVTDTYDFPTLIKRGYVYVDKTVLLHRMISGVDGTCFFMSRPRRFGKSLMISTLEQIFKGNKELFKGLAICKMDYDWGEYPIIRLDMSRFANVNGVNAFSVAFVKELRRRSLEAGIAFSADDSASVLLDLLINGLAERSQTGQAVVLVDEYAMPYAADCRKVVCIGLNYNVKTASFDAPLITEAIKGKVNGKVNDGVNGGVNDAVNDAVNSLYKYIKRHPGLNGRKLAVALSRSEPTIGRQVKTLKVRGCAEFRGAPKNGGYYAI